MTSGKTKKATYHTDELCCSILDAIHLHIEGEHEQSLLQSCQSEHPELLKAGPDMCEPDDVVPVTFDHEGWYVDDNDGATLPPEMVKEGRMNEMKGFEQRQVCTVCQRNECTDKCLHPMGVRWVDVAKKDVVRSRLVAQDFNNGKVEVEPFSPARKKPSGLIARRTRPCAASVRPY